MYSGWNRVLLMLASFMVAAVSAADQPASPDRLQRYIVEFHDAPLASYAGARLSAASPSSQQERY